jgi:hypothetical protein
MTGIEELAAAAVDAIGSLFAAAPEAIPAAVAVTPEVAGVGTAAAGGFTIGTAADVLALTGSAVSAASTIAAANSSAAALKFNQAQQQQEATTTEQSAAINAQQVEYQNAQRYGAAAAALGASGVDPSQGTPLDVMSDLTRQGELSRQLTLRNGTLTAQQLRAQAALTGAQSQQVQGAGAIAAGTTLVSSVAKNLGTRTNSPLAVPVSF